MPNTTAVEEILRAVHRKETALQEMHDRLAIARAQYQLAAGDYAAARDLATQWIGKFPYAGDVVWPDGRGNGTYRFIKMSAGDAVIAALQESEPLTAEEILSRVHAGSLGEYVTLRGLTAAMNRLDKVEQLPDGSYRLKSVEVDDLPFE